jgi:leader peptidase (prepilin peptidase)/N-methyltransferase
VPAGKSIVHPGSHCACGKPIAWFDNLPVLSWFLLRGKARCCGKPYSFRYALIELLTAALFLACALLFPPAKAVIGMVFLSGLICATFIDLDHMIIPEAFTTWLGILGVILSFTFPILHGASGDFPLIAHFRSGLTGLLGLLIGSGLILWIAVTAEALLRKEAMGFADVTFLGAIGAFCGWRGAIFAVFGGAILGTVWIGLAMLWQKLSGKSAPIAPRAELAEGQTAEKLGLGVQVPFGPMLAAGGAVYFLGGYHWFDAYIAGLATLF